MTPDARAIQEAREERRAYERAFLRHRMNLQPLDSPGGLHSKQYIVEGRWPQTRLRFFWWLLTGRK